jgi:hypothetical protein
MTLIEHSSAAERAATRFAATSPKSPGVESKILRPHAERPGKPLPAISLAHFSNSP